MEQPTVLVVVDDLFFLSKIQTTLQHLGLATQVMTQRAALQEYVGELRALGEFACGLAEALRFIRERVQSLHVAPERPRSGHLYACNLSQSGFAGRRHLFVIGLEEGRVFSSSTEDAVLLDVERRGRARRALGLDDDGGAAVAARAAGGDIAARLGRDVAHAALALEDGPRRIGEVQRLFGLRNFYLTYARKPKSYEGPQLSYYRKTTGLWMTGAILEAVGPAALTTDPAWGSSAGFLETQQRNGIVSVHPGGTTDIQRVQMARRIGIGRSTKEKAGTVHGAE